MEDSITVTRLEEGTGIVCLLIEGLPYEEETFPTILARSRGQMRREKSIDFVALPVLLQNGDITLTILPNMAYAQKLGMEAGAYLTICAQSADYVVDYYRALTRDIRERLLSGDDWETIIKAQFPEREYEKAEQLRRVAAMLAAKQSGFSEELETLEEEIFNMEVADMMILKTNVSGTKELTVQARLIDPGQSSDEPFPVEQPTEKEEKPKKQRKQPPKKRPNSPRRVGRNYRAVTSPT